ncbi:MAG: Ribosomal RNA small subunit methyltransferase I [Candidatus Giovannonibacteria bacterium GW2011_GWC2_44_9]|uniref:Ribosomal RNA small subunit methyltransferase I n=3 Tax=Candidatus Giovannoniibacteriota TaxID=1752738 RepID=A0A0G1IUT9_9BACT|nr:MAG: Ribosomal RNA small subunit methyltransferase I [Candidatus Giovannonibacteria bacterium GW2011_GWB1_44_23]KKT62895.1 MAG: Ribosomal RNA small subunit methyltransferase I [Candidatus Giovannonibacteria bacterium GW2011_GWA1_44_29]KKT83400.1 MAG: Ribosomal RNA small subunit methyltransferase I [Candidatus Giovannonibacteria bacterium GW2011_GWC2_44_9]KKT91089.1 MAG: Ribosomal RNA small subunit methyltransferase I [Parcubacteria group bacterium GW2011_GWC1_45_13]
MPKLFVVATPIGNLKDITLRAIEILKSVDFILAEDTRVTRKLLAHFDISKQIVSFQAHSSPKVLARVLDLLESGKDLALVTDAGTPGVSDPGQRLIKAAKDFAEIIPIPGPSALSAIISVSDINLSEFCFLGFPPRKKGRQTFFKRLTGLDIPIIIFESPHRIQKTLYELELACGDRYVNIGRELTKFHEEIFRGRLSEARKYFVGERGRGEFTIIINVK